MDGICIVKMTAAHRDVCNGGRGKVILAFGKHVRTTLQKEVVP